MTFVTVFPVSFLAGCSLLASPASASTPWPAQANQPAETSVAAAPKPGEQEIITARVCEIQGFMRQRELEPGASMSEIPIPAIELNNYNADWQSLGRFHQKNGQNRYLRGVNQAGRMK